MKQIVLVGALVAGLSTVLASAQTKTGGQNRVVLPKTQPATAPAPTAPSGEIALGSVRLSKGVMADGKKLPAGTYEVRVTAQAASPNAAGQAAGLERWMEFVQGGQVKGREVVTIIPQSETSLVQKDTPPARNASKFEMLQGGDYMRLWINRGGNYYIVHFPA